MPAGFREHPECALRRRHPWTVDCDGQTPAQMLLREWPHRGKDLCSLVAFLFQLLCLYCPWRLFRWLNACMFISPSLSLSLSTSPSLSLGVCMCVCCMCVCAVCVCVCCVYKYACVLCLGSHSLCAVTVSCFHRQPLLFIVQIKP